MDYFEIRNLDRLFVHRQQARCYIHNCDCV